MFVYPNRLDNSKYHNGKICRQPGCNKMAGTWWSPDWCFEHNFVRIQRIGEQLNLFERRFKPEKSKINGGNHV